MEQLDGTEMLNLMVSPVFCVKNGLIVKLNEAASRLFLREGIEIAQLLKSGAEDYAAFSGGLLYVTLCLYGQDWGATVTRMAQMDIFTLDQQFDSDELRVLALAARELRSPLTNAMLAAQQLSGVDDTHAARLNRGLHQLLRIIGNMSDASGCNPIGPRQVVNADTFFGEIIEKAAALTDQKGACIQFSGLGNDFFLSVHRQLLERAVLNMLSNALKFRNCGTTVMAELRRSGKMLRFSVTDEGCGMPDGIRASLFRRYLREPSIEDSRCGIGLGMLMIRNAAAAHGGAVLADELPGGGTRVTLTLSAEPADNSKLHAPMLQADYAGELDHALLELSEVLPAELYPM